MPVEELRAFLKEYLERHTLREAEEATGIGHETIRKFVEGETETPHPRSRAAYARLYWREKGLVFVAEETGVEGPLLWATALRTIFRGGKEQARADVEKLFELAGRHPGELPPSAAAMRRWLLELIEAEYRDAMPYRKPGGRKRKGGGGGASA